MNLDAETLIQQIPYYLTAEDQKVLLDELTAISRGGTAEYLLGAYRDSFKKVMLQGDGWRGFQLFLFETGERRSVRGIVLSNSCDVDPENPRDVPARVIFAPMVKLAAFKRLLAAAISAPNALTPRLQRSRRKRRATSFTFLRAAAYRKTISSASMMSTACLLLLTPNQKTGKNCLPLAILASTCSR
ncbi:hypothetical protein CKO11_14925 [Rhodobacter sp. TJ_12]|uniref:hypothetical protein n=1 Tax=Rhodobacter sp. TJ_12 TaxID=2029399 RepID=UPI001CBD31A5|nr:hypothetical protein [Rhodobacter sp. TJ_12]MBZ4023745.1 hypothetical protein [Rhodobacter sp. TJ_12]